ncbi:hypothetical protein QR97_01760 [Streptomyces sp. PBH53]|uniref:hypothetical protein n=1 Tax=Streptomyces sp. PBH53 TaxID=1577075 RepID=UPI0006551992|nr:hypothetical protein [Streptomyces sp. PBH53]AKN68698.1 hypothetical protein QR97_01760 [Streptomyces sp. PBH53]
MTSTTPVADLTMDQVTISRDRYDRAVVVLPDAIAERLAVSSHTDVKGYGYNHFESRPFDADTWETRAVHAIFDALLQACPEERQWGLGQYRRYGTGYFYGWVVGESGWDTEARNWKDPEATKHLHVNYGLHIHHDGRSHFGS